MQKPTQAEMDLYNAWLDSRCFVDKRRTFNAQEQAAIDKVCGWKARAYDEENEVNQSQGYRTGRKVYNGD